MTIDREFGATGWGWAWVRVVESTAVSAPNPLLPKARSLARNDFVHLRIGGGAITAAVSESAAASKSAAQHVVELPISPWSERDRNVARPLIREATVGSAPGDLPDRLLRRLAEAGVQVAAPEVLVDAHCSCHGRKRPCAHILATVYALATMIDERPTLAVELRGDSITTDDRTDPDWIPIDQLTSTGYYAVERLR